VSNDDHDMEGVSVPETSLRFSENDMTIIKQIIDPSGHSDSYGIDLYVQTIQH